MKLKNAKPDMVPMIHTINGGLSRSMFQLSGNLVSGIVLILLLVGNSCKSGVLGDHSGAYGGPSIA